MAVIVLTYVTIDLPTRQTANTIKRDARFGMIGLFRFDLNFRLKVDSIGGLFWILVIYRIRTEEIWLPNGYTDIELFAGDVI